MLMETCHGGGLVDARSMAGSMRDVANRVHDISELNTIVICACLPDEFSAYSKKLPAAYMPIFFDEAMRNLPRPVTVQAAFKYYQQKLSETLGAIQEPTMTDNALIPVVLVPATNGGPAGQSPAGPASAPANATPQSATPPN
jgi:hypothetical protein